MFLERGQSPSSSFDLVDHKRGSLGKAGANNPRRTKMKSSMPILCLAPAMFFAAPLPAQQTSQYQSHPPLRPLPEASSRPTAAGPGRYVDAVKGNDANDGTREQPWQTVSHAVRQLSAGDTLYLRGGTYYEHVKLTQSGQPGQPITIRSYPGELVILDGGFREFFENPAGSCRSDARDPADQAAPAGCHRCGGFAQSSGRSAGAVRHPCGGAAAAPFCGARQSRSR